jgi:ABC-type antimicrobial peptide transport system permease subunit
MAAVPAGYEAFHSKRRRGVTLLCFLLASTMAMGITVYVDSYSVHEWDSNLDVGQIAILASGEGIENYVEDIQAIDGVTKAESLLTAWGQISYMRNSTYGWYEEYLDGDIISPSQEFMETFDGYITLEQGAFPSTNSSEIAIFHGISEHFGIGIGDVVNFTSWWDEDFEPVEVIGIYKQGGEESSSQYWWRFDSIAIVTPDAIVEIEYTVFIDIDRTRLSAFNAAGSLAYSNGIDNAIIAIDPNYDPQFPWRSRFWAQNRITSGIQLYMSWVSAQRISQLFRSSSIIILIVMVTFLAIRHNVNERRFEASVLRSRGASSGDLDKIINREILVLSILSCILGIVFGFGVSRVALAATGYFQFDFSLMLSEPFLVSIESFIISIVAGIALPLLALGSYRIVYSTKKSVDEDKGRLSKLVKGLNFIKWDVLIVVMSGLLLVVLMSTGLNFQSDTGGFSYLPGGSAILGFVFSIVPLPLFLGVASLSIKGLRRGATRISRFMTRVVGQVSASVGIRRIGKGASSGGAAAMVMVLAICLSWNSAIIDASLPLTKTYQAQLDVGADISFSLDNYQMGLWEAFNLNVTSHVNVTSSTYVSQIGLSLSSDYDGWKNFLAVHPREYSMIGYHYQGMRLNDSELAISLESLETILDGAILSEDIAQQYDLEVGDILRATDFEEEAIVFTFRVIGVVKAIPEMPADDDWYFYDYFIPPPVPFYPFYPSTTIVGQDRVLINREYLRSLYGSLNQTDNYLCVSTTESANGSEIATSLLEAGGNVVIDQNLWDSVSSQTDEFLGQTSYHIDRSVDTMMTVLTVGTIMGAFAIYAVEGVRARKREIALLRSAGADSGLIVRAQGAEMLILMLFSFVVLLGYSPLFLSTSISVAGSATATYYNVYPIPVFPVFPWMTIITVLAFFIVSVLIFIGIVAILGSRINLAETLNASWSEAAPYGDDL